jgi:hypothetical protein
VVSASSMYVFVWTIRKSGPNLLNACALRWTNVNRTSSAGNICNVEKVGESIKRGWKRTDAILGWKYGKGT